MTTETIPDGFLLYQSEHRNNWPEARIIAEPVGPKELNEPRVLVKRQFTDLIGSRGEQLVYLPGQPAISLFTGAGGFDIGIERAQFCVVVQHEMEKCCCETLIANRPMFFRHAALIQGDIRKTPTSMILREGGLRVGETAIIFGGPPCQGYSTTNTRRTLDDPRNSLIFDFLRVVREAQPQFFIFENVPGFVSMAENRFLREFLKEAYNSYYELVYGLVEASEYGVPQHRCRFICNGTRRDIFEIDDMLASLPAPQHFDTKDIKVIKTLSEREYDLYTHAPGIRYFPDRELLIPPSPLGNRRSDGSLRRSKRFIEFYRRLEKEEPGRIVKAPVTA